MIEEHDNFMFINIKNHILKVIVLWKLNRQLLFNFLNIEPVFRAVMFTDFFTGVLLESLLAKSSNLGPINVLLFLIQPDQINMAVLFWYFE